MPSIDFHLENEIAKATNMLLTLKNTLGEEKIPRELLDIAKGVVFLTIIKVGFMFTGRYGTGLIVAKLPDGRWSAPSAIMITGLGWGLQVGAEITEGMLILSTDQAVNTFKSKAQVALGAELGVSVGPIGRGIASDVAASNKGAAHAFSYVQSKGLFFGASLEASGIASRPDVNRAFYGENVSISSILCGDYPAPKGAEPLYRAIDEVLFDISPSPSSKRSGGGGGDEVSVPLNPRYSNLNQYDDSVVTTNTGSDKSNASATNRRGTSGKKELLDDKIHEL
jgi:lipid-binding SYLF domain-containing protein